ncbi:MAG: glutathione S-transferase N-terminal domain-containing protein [Pseudomonadota bacterium]
MIELFYWPTPNCWKITIMLEECGLAYKLRPVDITQGHQFNEEFQTLSPNGRVPAIRITDNDSTPLTIFESGAILTYLADRTGQFLPETPAERSHVLEWLFWQVGGFGPMAGQLSHFMIYNEEKIPYAINRYTKEYARLLGVLDKQLKKQDYIAKNYSIADMAIWPWLLSYKRFRFDLSKWPNVRAWHERMKARPAASRGIDVGKDYRVFR